MRCSVGPAQIGVDQAHPGAGLGHAPRRSWPPWWTCPRPGLEEVTTIERHLWSRPANWMLVRRLRYASAAGDLGSTCAIEAGGGPLAAGLARSAMAYRFAANWGHDADHRQPQVALHVVGRLHGGVEVLDRQRGADADQQSHQHATIRLTILARAGSAPAARSRPRHAHVVGLEPAGDAGLLEALEHRLVELLVGVGRPAADSGTGSPSRSAPGPRRAAG